MNSIQKFKQGDLVTVPSVPEGMEHGTTGLAVVKYSYTDKFGHTMPLAQKLDGMDNYTIDFIKEDGTILSESAWYKSKDLVSMNKNIKPPKYDVNGCCGKCKH